MSKGRATAGEGEVRPELCRMGGCYLPVIPIGAKRREESKAAGCGTALSADGSPRFLEGLGMTSGMRAGSSAVHGSTRLTTNECGRLHTPYPRRMGDCYASVIPNGAKRREESKTADCRTALPAGGSPRFLEGFGMTLGRLGIRLRGGPPSAYSRPYTAGTTLSRNVRIWPGWSNDANRTITVSAPASAYARIRSAARSAGPYGPQRSSQMLMP